MQPKEETYESKTCPPHLYPPWLNAIILHLLTIVTFTAISEQGRSKLPLFSVFYCDEVTISGVLFPHGDHDETHGHDENHGDRDGSKSSQRDIHNHNNMGNRNSHKPHSNPHNPTAPMQTVA